MKLICYILIVILQCTLSKDLSDCISNEKPKVVVSFRDNKELSELKNDIDIFEQSILENINLEDHTWVKPGLYEICETDFNLNISTVDSYLVNYHDWFFEKCVSDRDCD